MQNTMERVAVQLHLGHRSEGGPTVSKVWRFSSTEQYTRKRVQEELVSLFPDVRRRDLKFQLWYYDDLAGELS